MFQYHILVLLLKLEMFSKFLAKKLIESKDIEFVKLSHTFALKDLPGEQMTMFFYDPAGNALEFKAFKNQDQIFAT